MGVRIPVKARARRRHAREEQRRLSRRLVEQQLRPLPLHESDVRAVLQGQDVCVRWRVSEVPAPVNSQQPTFNIQQSDNGR